MWIAVDSSLKAETPSPMNIYTFLRHVLNVPWTENYLDDVLILKISRLLGIQKVCVQMHGVDLVLSLNATEQRITSTNSNQVILFSFLL